MVAAAKLIRFNYDLCVISRKLLKEIFIILLFVCICTSSIYEGVHTLMAREAASGGAVCVRHPNLSNPTAATQKSLAITMKESLAITMQNSLTQAIQESLGALPSGVTSSPELSEISGAVEAGYMSLTDAISAPLETVDTTLEPPVAMPLPDDTADNATPPSDPIESELLYSGFLVSESGIITGCVKTECNLEDGLLILPSAEKCTGIDTGAFAGIENDVYELFIPKNITYIAQGALDSLGHLTYIQVMDGNPSFYSEKGSLYNIDGTPVMNPMKKNQPANDKKE